MTRLLPALILLVSPAVSPAADLASAVVFKGTDTVTYTSPVLVQAGNGDVLAFAMRKEGKDWKTILRRSTDSGTTWTEDTDLLKDVKLDSVCPVATNEGKLLLLGTVTPSETDDGRPASLKWLLARSEFVRTSGAKILVFNSDDNGQSWTQTADLTDRMWTYPRAGLTRWRGRGIELSDGPNKGRILMPGHHFDVKSQEPDNDTHCHVLYSDNGGKNWSFGGRTRGFSFEGNLVEMEKGRFAFHTPTLWSGYVGHRAYEMSLDGGKTFEISQKIPDFAELRPTIAGVTRLPGKEGQKPLLLLSSPASPKDKRNDLTLQASFDDGRSWSPKLIQEGFAAASDLLALKDGTILCLFETDEYRSLKVAKFDRTWVLGE